MKKRINIIWVLYLICMVFNPLHSQTKSGFSPNDFVGEPIEEVGLQTDRDIYLAGESIWFSAFCTIINESNPSPISQILYIEVYNARHKVFLREKFKLHNGQTSGHLTIPEETPTGYYYIRAYTRYLRNFPLENYHISSLTIINPEIPQSAGNVNDKIIMLPEGQNLISDQQTHLAVKIPHSIVEKTTAAFLTDYNGIQLDELHFYNNGLCLINFIPNDSTWYYLKLRFHNGDSLLSPILEPIKKGISVQTKIVGNELHIKTISSKSEQENSSNYILKVLSESFHQTYKDDVILNQHTNELVIQLSELPKGLSYVVLADKNDSLLSFNPVYFDNGTIENIQVSIQKSNYNAREKVDLDIQFPQPHKNDFKQMTVSVVKKGTVILSENLIPDVVIENPCLLKSYFEKTPARSSELMEQINIALILYSSNARNSYQKSLVQKKSDQIYFPEIRDVSISGFLLDKKTREPMKDIQMFASVLFEDFQLHTTKTMDDGSFVFTLNHLTQKHNLYLFPDIEEGGEHELFIHNDFSTQFRDLNECTPIIDSSFLQLIEELYFNQQILVNFPIQTVNLQEIKKLSPWFGVEMTTVKLSDYIDLTSFREVINEIVPSVRLKENNDQYRFSIFDENAQISYEDPLVLLDHIPVTDINELIKIHPALIEKIEVMNQPYILGNYTIWGLILITTKTDDFARIQLPEESAFLNYQTLKNNATLVPLDFSTESMANSSNPFFNTVLYWDPKYHIDEPNGNNISFYTSDHLADYEVIIRGIKSDGGSCTGSAFFSVTVEE